MFNRIRCKIYLRTDSKSRTTGLQPIYFNLSINGERIKKHSGFFIDEKDWDEKIKLVKSTSQSQHEINSTLNNFKSLVDKIASDANLEKIKLSVSLFNKRIEIQNISGDFIDYMEQQAKTRIKLKPSSRTVHLNTAKILRKYFKKLEVADITQPMMIQLIEKLYRKKYSENYIHSIVKNVRTYWKLIQKQTGVKLNTNPFEDLGTNWVERKIEFLSIRELQLVIDHFMESLENYNYHNSYLVALNYYLFSCHTGLRISDVTRIGTFNMQNNVLNFKPKKQQLGKEKEFSIPLSEGAVFLYQKLKEFNFPYVAQPTIRKHIKQMCVKCKLGKELKFHSSRHTFITTLLKLNTSPLITKELATHADIKTTMKYAHVLLEDKTEAIKVMDRLNSI